MRIAFIAAKFPYGTNEAYLGTDLEELAQERPGSLSVWPVSPDLRSARREGPALVYALPLFGWRTLTLAIREVFRQPGLVASLTGLMLRDCSNMRVVFKNLAVFPKALALAQRARLDGIEHIHAYWLSTPATVALIVSRLTGIPWSATAHRWDIYEENLIPAKLQSAAFVRTISERGRADLARLAAKVAAQLRTIRVGVRLPETAAQPRSRAKVLHLLCAANLVPVKGHRFAIEAIARARTTGFAVSATFAGDGPLRKTLQALAHRLNVSDFITFRGFVEHEILLDEVASGAYDAAILASIEEPGGLMEGIPVSLIEAMAHGLPCIATDSGSIRELITEGCGIIVPHSDAMKLSLAIEVLAGSPKQRLAIGERGRARVADAFDRKVCVQELARLIERAA